MGKFQRVYRVVPNKDCNDFNGALPYTILPYDLDEKNNRMKRGGWNNWHEVIEDYFLDRQGAEQVLVSKCCGSEKTTSAIMALENLKSAICCNSGEGGYLDKVVDLFDLMGVIDDQIKLYRNLNGGSDEEDLFNP